MTKCRQQCHTCYLSWHACDALLFQPVPCLLPVFRHLLLMLTVRLPHTIHTEDPINSINCYRSQWTSAVLSVFTNMLHISLFLPAATSGARTNPPPKEKTLQEPFLALGKFFGRFAYFEFLTFLVLIRAWSNWIFHKPTPDCTCYKFIWSMKPNQIWFI